MPKLLKLSNEMKCTNVHLWTSFWTVVFNTSYGVIRARSRPPSTGPASPGRRFNEETGRVNFPATSGTTQTFSLASEAVWEFLPVPGHPVRWQPFCHYQFRRLLSGWRGCLRLTPHLGGAQHLWCLLASLLFYCSCIRFKLDYDYKVYSFAAKPLWWLFDSIHHAGICLGTGAFRASAARCWGATLDQWIYDRRKSSCERTLASSASPTRFFFTTRH